MNGRSGNSGTRGFTLVELLVVVAIIILLAAILLPALFAAKTYAKESAIRTYLSHLSGALDKYYADFNFYPDSGDYISTTNRGNTYGQMDSNGNLTGTKQLTSGSARLAEGLMGYLGYGTFTGTTYNNDGDGAGGSSSPAVGTLTPDSTYGFRMATSVTTDQNGNVTYAPPSQTLTVGRIYGPYMTVNSSNYASTPGTPIQGVLPDQYFIDPLGNRILYYKAHGVSTLPPTTSAPTAYFSTAAQGTGIFYTDDNSNLKGTLAKNTTQAATGTNSLNPIVPTTYYPITNFLSLLGDNGGVPAVSGNANNNVIDAGETPLDATTYLLVSPGVSGHYFDRYNIINTK